MTEDEPAMPPTDPGDEDETAYEGTLTETSETDTIEDDEETDDA